MSELMSEYRAPYDGVVMGVTIFAAALLGGVGLMMLVLALAIDVAFVRVVFGLCAVLILSILAFSYLLAPKRFRIEPHRIAVERPAGPLVVALDPPVVAWRTERLGFTIRTGGNGGLFGAYGRFRNRDLGSFRTYARRSRDYVVVSTGSQTLVFGPEDPDRFASDVRAAASAG